MIDSFQTMSIAVTDTGDVYSWGYNGNGQLGVGNIINQAIPCRVPGLQGTIIVQVNVMIRFTICCDFFTTVVVANIQLFWGLVQRC